MVEKYFFTEVYVFFYFYARKGGVNMAVISLGNVGNSSAENQFGYGEKSGLSSEMRKSDLQRRINSCEQELDNINKSEATEVSKINLEISKYKNQLRKIEDNGNSDELSEAEQKRRFDSFECETCKNRRYKDQSDDSGVSYQTATHIDPAASYSAVRSHENEHVTRNRTDADRNGQKIVYQTVTIKRGICPECGRSYTAGGVTKSVTKADNSSKYTVGDLDLEKDPIGKIVNIVA
jgi:hypothetical protein